MIFYNISTFFQVSSSMQLARTCFSILWPLLLPPPPPPPPSPLLFPFIHFPPQRCRFNDWLIPSFINWSFVRSPVSSFVPASEWVTDILHIYAEWCITASVTSFSCDKIGHSVMGGIFAARWYYHTVNLYLSVGKISPAFIGHLFLKGYVLH